MIKFLSVNLWASLLALAFYTLPVQAGDGAEGTVPVLQTKTEVYNNVTLVSRTPTHLFVRHSRGVATIKVVEVGADALRQLGLYDAIQAAPIASGSSKSGVKTRNSSASIASLAGIGFSFVKSLKSRLPAGSSGLTLPDVGRAMLIRIMVVFALCHLFLSYCAMLICRKAGSEPGVLIWLPLVQIVPLLRAARMSAWWFVGFLLPLINLVAFIMWCVKIAEVRGKGIFTAIMLILPVTGIFALLYLAFSDNEAAEEEPGELDPWQRKFSDAI